MKSYKFVGPWRHEAEGRKQPQHMCPAMPSYQTPRRGSYGVGKSAGDCQDWLVIARNGDRGGWGAVGLLSEMRKRL